MIPLTHANIIEILGIEALPLEERVALVEEATNLVETRTLARMMELLSPTEQEALANLMEAQDDAAIDALIERKGIDVITLAQEETEKLKQELLVVAERAKND